LATPTVRGCSIASGKSILVPTAQEAFWSKRRYRVEERAHDLITKRSQNHPMKENNVNKTDSNRLNAQNSTGPGDTTLTRFNAVKHGLLAKGLTELDDSDAYESWVQRLTRDYDPVGDLEIFWVRRIAFCMTRLDRAARLEANYVNAEIHPPSQEQDCMARNTSELGLSTAIGALSAINLVSGFQRYETAIENKLYRAIHELERRQRMRKGEFVPAPQSLDVSIHAERET